MGKAGHITEDYRAILKGMIDKNEPKDLLLIVLAAIPSCPCDPSLDPATEPKPIAPPGKKGAGKGHGPLLPLGVKARYLENGTVKLEAKTPTALAKALQIKPAKFVLTGHRWDGKTCGTEGYRTTLHAFTANGYEVDIGDGWGDYSNDNKPYGKFDVRNK